MGFDPDFFLLLAIYLQPQNIKRSYCERCKNFVRATKTLKFLQFPELVVFTLQRFASTKTGEITKNYEPTCFPLALDFTFLTEIEYTENSTAEAVAQKLRVVMMPWLFFKVEADEACLKQECDEAFGMLSNERFMTHLWRYYKNVETIDTFVKRDYQSSDAYQRLPYFPAGAPPQFK